MGLLDQPDQQAVAGLQILPAGRAAGVSAGIGVVIFPLGNQTALVADDDSQMRIHMLVVLAVILVIGRGHENGVQINSLHLQFLQIIQLVYDALQVAPVEIAHIHLGRRLLPVRDAAHRLINVNVLPVQHVVGRVAVAEAVRIDLVHHRSPGPLGHMESRRDAEIKAVPQVVAHAQAVIVADLVPLHDTEIISKHMLPHAEAQRVKIKSFIKALPAKRRHLAGSLLDQQHTVHISAAGSETKGHRIPRVGLAGTSEVLRLVAEQSISIYIGLFKHKIPSLQLIYILFILYEVRELYKNFFACRREVRRKVKRPARKLTFLGEGILFLWGVAKTI